MIFGDYASKPWAAGKTSMLSTTLPDPWAATAPASAKIAHKPHQFGDFLSWTG